MLFGGKNDERDFLVAAERVRKMININPRATSTEWSEAPCVCFPFARDFFLKNKNIRSNNKRQRVKQTNIFRILQLSQGRNEDIFQSEILFREKLSFGSIIDSTTAHILSSSPLALSPMGVLNFSSHAEEKMEFINHTCDAMEHMSRAQESFHVGPAKINIEEVRWLPIWHYSYCLNHEILGSTSPWKKLRKEKKEKKVASMSSIWAIFQRKNISLW